MQCWYQIDVSREEAKRSRLERVPARAAPLPEANVALRRLVLTYIFRCPRLGETREMIVRELFLRDGKLWHVGMPDYTATSEIMLVLAFPTVSAITSGALVNRRLELLAQVDGREHRIWIL